jgi:hypothetical protein
VLRLDRLLQVVLDIEGTTTPISFVHDVLFGYVRTSLSPFLADNTARESVAEAMAHYSAPDTASLTTAIVAAMDADDKVPCVFGSRDRDVPVTLCHDHDTVFIPQPGSAA